MYFNQQGALVKKIFRNLELIWRGANDAVLIFVSPYFEFCLSTEAAVVARFSFIIEGIKETENGYSKNITYYSLALFLLIEGSCMQNNQFWFCLKLGR